VAKDSIKEIDKFLRSRGMSLEGDEETRRERAKNRRWRESPAYKKTQKKYRESKKGKKTIASYVAGPHREVQQRYFERNKPDFAARTAKYRATVKRATPLWALNNPVMMNQINKMYQAAASMPGKWEVNHIVPLEATESRKKGARQIASGLHVPWNLEILPRRTNRSISTVLPITRGTAGLLGPANVGGGFNENILQIWPQTSNLFSYIPRPARYKKKKK